jgi:hypothetical protein
MISFGRGPSDEGIIRAAAESSGCAERARPWVLAATILGSSMAFIDGSVVTVALPAIQADLTMPVAGAQWVEAQREPKIEPDRVLDDFGRKAIAAIPDFEARRRQRFDHEWSGSCAS